MTETSAFMSLPAEQCDNFSNNHDWAALTPMLHYVTKPSLLRADIKCILPLFDTFTQDSWTIASATVLLPLRANEDALPITWLPECLINIHVPSVRKAADGIHLHHAYEHFHPHPMRTLHTYKYATKVMIRIGENFINVPPRVRTVGVTHPSLIHAILATLPIPYKRIKLFESGIQDMGFNFYRFGSLPAYRPGDLMNKLIDNLFDRRVPNEFWSPGTDFIELKYLSRNGKRLNISFQERDDGLVLYINTRVKPDIHQMMTSCASDESYGFCGDMYRGYFALETILFMMENYLTA